MQVKVEHGLLSPLSAIEDAAVVGVAELGHDLGRDDEESADEFAIGGGNFGESGDDAFGDGEQVDGGLRGDVADDDVLVVLVLDGGGNLPGDDFFE